MQLSAHQHFQAAPDQVFALTTEPAFLEQVCRDLGAASQQVTVTPTATGPHSDVLVTIETPGPLVAFAGATLTVRQGMTWGAAAADRSREARLSIAVVGLPVTVDALARLRPDGPGTVIDYDGTLSVALPIVGSLVEKAAAPFILETLAVQEQSAKAWLGN